MSVDDDVREMRELLEQEDLVPGAALLAYERFSDEVKDALIADVARQFTPAPSGKLLARLVPVVTNTSRPVLTGVYLTNLRSPDPQARVASLQGLVALGYPQVTDLALASLRDDTDAVVSAAAAALLPLAAGDQQVRDLLGAVLATHRDDPEFHVTVNLLTANNIEPRETP